MAVQQLSAHEVFRFLRPEQLDLLSNAAERVSQSAGDTIYYRGTKAEFLYVLLDGQVALRLPGRNGINVLIDQPGPGTIFGSCVCVDLDTYTLTAQCVTACELLRIQASVLKQLMDKDAPMGYSIQRQISRIYFQRYIDAMKKLQAIVQSLPLEPS
jgi:CRP-like cAMP-binding protein